MLPAKEIGISSGRLGHWLLCAFTVFLWGGGGNAIATTKWRGKIANNFAPLNSPMMQFHVTPIQSPRKLKIVNRGNLVRLMSAKALGTVQRDR